MALQLPANAGRLSPWPVDEGIPTASNDLDIAVKIETALGWVELDDGKHYGVHSESLATRSYTYRTRSVSSEFIEGSYAVTSVRENVNETLAIWVSGDTHYEWRTYTAALTDALQQLTYQVMVRIEDMVEYWDCQPAGYNIETQREFVHARIGIVRATIPRLPAVLIAQATGDET